MRKLVLLLVYYKTLKYRNLKFAAQIFLITPSIVYSLKLAIFCKQEFAKIQNSTHNWLATEL